MQVIEVFIHPKEEKVGFDREDIFEVKLFNPRFVNQEKQESENVDKPRLGKRRDCVVEIIGDDEILDKAKDIELVIDQFNKQKPVSW